MTLALWLAFPSPAWSMCIAGLALLIVGLWAAMNNLARARGIDKVVALTPLCFAIPLAVFGAEHLSMPNAMLNLVPKYMPGRMFWVYFVGFALLAAALSIATGIQVRWSGLLVGIMMFLFVAMIHLPGAIASGGRIIWTIVFRELSFGGGGLVLAGIDMGGASAGRGRIPIAAGRVLIALTAIFFGVQHFLHPLGLPGVPLVKQMPAWLPAPAVIDYLTGAILIAAGICFLLARQTRLAAACAGASIVLLVLAIYGPVLIAALRDSHAAVKIEGINYFADTLLFGGVMLSLAASGTVAKLRGHRT